MEFSVRTSQIDERVVVLHVSGELDMATAPTLQGAFATAVGSGAEHVVVDTTELEFIDSTGLGVLVSGSRMLPPGGELRMVVTSPSIRRLLGVTGLDRALPVFGDVRSATQPRPRGLPSQHRPGPCPGERAVERTD